MPTLRGSVGRRAVQARSLAGLLLLWASAAYAAEDQKITFHFNPPDGTALVETVSTTKVVDMGASTKQTQRGETKGKVTFRRMGSGYTVSATLTSVKVTRNGKPITDPMLSGLVGRTVAYDVSDDGQLERVRGVAEVVEAIRKQLPPAALRTLGDTLTEDAWIQRETTEWNGRIGGFAGASVTLGETWMTTDEYPLPSGDSLTFYSATTFAANEKRAGHDCVRITFRYDTDATALAKLLGKKAEELQSLGMLPGKPPKVAGAQLTGSGYRIIDPKTMLLYDEVIRRSVVMRMDIPGKGRVTITSDETRQYTREYTK